MKYDKDTIFHDISKNDYQRMLQCLKAKEKNFTSNETIYSYGEHKQSIGILQMGEASILRYEYNGSRTILEKLTPHSIFGEILAFYLQEYSCISVVSDRECTVLFIDYNHIIHPCSNVCSCHTQLIHNMLNLLSEKSRLLSERIEVLSQRTIREKLLCYFMQLSSRAKQADFEIPFSMMDFADFLCVNRSAMIREIKKMKEDEMISLNKRRVTLHI